jgi:arginase
MDRRLGLVGVPSSAGAHTPGLEKGPAAVRAAGLVERLRSAGVVVEDHGDVEAFRWRPDPDHPRAQNASAVVRVAAATAAAVEEALAGSYTPLVIGGDCTITVGVVAGFARFGARPALLYVDGGPDLFTPQTRPNGNLDATGLAHLLGLAGHLPELAGIGPEVPLLTPGEVLAYGHSLPEQAREHRLLNELGVPHMPLGEVQQDPWVAARRARTWAETTAPAFVVHLDVDVLQFVDAPLADVPEPFGLTLQELAVSLATFTASAHFAGLVVTEINPDHVPDAEILQHFVETLTDALSK